MNRRIYKKLCKRAMTTLIAKHGYKAQDFATVKRGDERNWSAPHNMENHRYRWAGLDLFVPGFAPLKGTPGYWERVSYEYDEWEFKSPVEILDQIEVAEAISDEIDAIGIEAFLAKYEETVPA